VRLVRSADSLLNVADARRRARRVLPRVVFDYVDGGAEDEVTMLENIAAFRDLAFRPRMAVGAPEPEIAVRIFGTDLELPVILAPCGLVRLMHLEGAAGAARAAAAKGTISVLSTVAGSTPEEVAAACKGPMWFQLYAAGGRPQAEPLMERAASAGFEVLVVTVDTPVLGHRERDLRHGVDPPLRITSKGVVQLGSQVLRKPVWAWHMARDGISLFGGAPGSAGGEKRAKGAPSGQTTPSAKTVAAVASPFKWSDLEWMRGRWSGPLVVKGVLGAPDAERSVACGADGVIVSNHGGRQLEGAPAALRVLPEVVAAVGDDTEVLVDGGIRRGSDVVKAIALGAKAVLIGRPYMYGLAAGGQVGVERVLEILREEMTRTLTLMGSTGLAELDGSWLQPARGAQVDYSSSPEAG
jgi:L-lactate dehydrogenase (cytochrome)